MHQLRHYLSLAVRKATERGMKKNDIITIDIKKTSSDGRGIGYVDGKICFVAGTLCGETVRAKIYTIHPSYMTAGTLEIITPSPYRRHWYCKNSNECGGCPLAHIDYRHQLDVKRAHVADTLERIGKVNNAETLVEETLGMDEPFSYRNKMVFPIGMRKNQAIGGFFAAKSHDIIELDSCAVGEKCAIVALSVVLDFMNEEKISAYDEKTHTGTIKKVFVRTGYHSHELMVVVSSAQEKIKSLDKLIEKLKHADFGTYNLKSVILNINTKRNNLILGDKNITLFGSDTICDSILGFDFSISPHSFFQINPVQTEVLYKKALELADINKDKTVLDVYCGIGTISLCASKKAKSIIGVEIVDIAIQNAIENAEKNSVDNANFLCGAAEDIVPELIKNGKNPDIVILDPPRKGSDEKTLSAIVSATPERIVYVSCNPATLARDVRFLSENGYSLISATPVDMFPNSEHIECVALLSK